MRIETVSVNWKMRKIRIFPKSGDIIDQQESEEIENVKICKSLTVTSLSGGEKRKKSLRTINKSSKPSLLFAMGSYGSTP